MKRLILFSFLAVTIFPASAQQKVPSFEEVLALQSPGQVVMSNDGQLIAYTRQSTEWQDNRFDTEIWLSKAGMTPFQLTNTTKGSSTSPRFSPDGQWLAFLADRGQKQQIFVLNLAGGEAQQITAEEESVSAFEWHPDGRSFIFLKPDKDKPDRKERDKRYGAYEIDDQEYQFSHLWQITFEPGWWSQNKVPCYETIDSLKSKAGCPEGPKAKRLTEGTFTVTGFDIAPDGQKLAYNRQPDPLINSFIHSDIAILNLQTGQSEVVVANSSADALACWSPSSIEFIFTTNLEDTLSNFYKNSFAYIYHLPTKVSRRIAQSMDEDLGDFYWHQKGINLVVWQKTSRPVFHVLEGNGALQKLPGFPDLTMSLAFSKDGNHAAVLGRNFDQLTEVYYRQKDTPARKITDFTAQIQTWAVGTSEVISWRSKDGTTIEGILHKPDGFEVGKKYPLLVVIHGGPTGIDVPQPVPAYVYPITQWLAKGCLVLRPNYRGSAGYGEAFRSLNVRNLGVGDVWDVLSGVDQLVNQNMVDTNKLGAMGWSQGGYISAFLTTTTHRFKAISVGAGISDWMTYYVNTDIHPFTRQYLRGTPWDDPAIYQKTSPMTYINEASTPTLIQHGEFDRRVPIPNAYQLLQGLRDKNVPAELVVYKGFGHGITKPKERLAALWHNWQWFNRFIWKEEVKIPGL